MAVLEDCHATALNTGPPWPVSTKNLIMPKFDYDVIKDQRKGVMKMPSLNILFWANL